MHFGDFMHHSYNRHKLDRPEIIPDGRSWLLAAPPYYLKLLGATLCSARSRLSPWCSPSRLCAGRSIASAGAWSCGHACTYSSVELVLGPVLAAAGAGVSRSRRNARKLTGIKAAGRRGVILSFDAD